MRLAAVAVGVACIAWAFFVDLALLIRCGLLVGGKRHCALEPRERRARQIQRGVRFVLLTLLGVGCVWLGVGGGP